MLNVVKMLLNLLSEYDVEMEETTPNAYYRGKENGMDFTIQYGEAIEEHPFPYNQPSFYVSYQKDGWKVDLAKHRIQTENDILIIKNKLDALFRKE